MKGNCFTHCGLALMSVAVGLVAGFLPLASADEVLIPRLGFTTLQAKTLTIVPSSSKAIAEATTPKASDAKKPVEGDFYLYSSKAKALVYNAKGRQLNGSDDGIRQVEFKDPVLPGLYKFAVQGTGHVSLKPVLVSDDIYWNAIGPILRDMGNDHCPVQKGVFVSLQSCYALPLVPAEQNIDPLLAQTKLVKGGWFVKGSDLHIGVVKDTLEIASTTNMLLNLYALNPDGFKYLEVDGLSFKESPVPDVLDEANWGLQYLLTAQHSNGAFPAGLQGQPTSRYYYPESPSFRATAVAVSALSQGASVFQTTNLAYALKMQQAALKAYQWLESQPSVNDADMALAKISVLAMMKTPAFVEGFNKTPDLQTSLQEIGTDELTSINDLLLLSNRLTQLGFDTSVMLEGQTGSVNTVSELKPLLAQFVLSPTPAGYLQLSKAVESLYGYETVSFNVYTSFKMASGVRDPLAFLALKTGHAIERYNAHLVEKNIIAPKAELPAEQLKEYENLESEAKGNAIQGYKMLNLGVVDKALLAYALGVLSQQQPLLEELTPKSPKQLKLHKKMIQKMQEQQQ